MRGLDGRPGEFIDQGLQLRLLDQLEHAPMTLVAELELVVGAI